MKLVDGDMWMHELGKADIIFATCNSLTDQHGHLIMGRGAALEAKHHFPWCPEAFGKQLIQRRNVGGLYGILIARKGTHIVGAFQTKNKWYNYATTNIIGLSTTRLNKLARSFPDRRFAVNFPGIGLGGLTEAQVLPIIQSLPDNVFVYRKGSNVGTEQKTAPNEGQERTVALPNGDHIRLLPSKHAAGGVVPYYAPQHETSSWDTDGGFCPRDEHSLARTSQNY